MYYLKKSSIFLISIPVLTTIMLLGYFCTPKTEAATDCCYHECNMTEPNKCEGNNVMACTLGPGCDGDNYNDWCLLQDCSLTGQMCAGGVCGGVSPSPTCADNTPYNQCSVNTGKPWYCNNSGNLIENCGLCGCAGTWVCGPAFTFCCDGACNNTCSNINCSIAKDPDCGVGGCCGDGTCNAAETNATCAVDCPVCINGTTQNCGSNVGECQQGTKTCVSGAWSPICAGEITPKAEICGNGLDEDCDGTSDEGCVDVIDPIVTSFSVSFNSATNISTASFSVTDNVNLNKVELWVAPDNLGVPGVWVNVSQSNISGLSYTGTLSDTPSSGIFWYGLHVIDASANMGSEPNPPGPIWINKVVTLSGAHGIVFYKTSTTIGNVGGRSGADSFCQSNKPSELTCNNIHAFISTNASDEIRDMPTNYTYPIDAELYWYNKNTNNFTLFASNWADMLDGSILASPATGLGVFAGNFWTGSQNDGSITPDAAAVGSCTGLFWSYQCNNWTFNGIGDCTVGNPYFGTQGNSNSVNNWIRNTSNFSMCSDSKPLLCSCISNEEYGSMDDIPDTNPTIMYKASITHNANFGGRSGVDNFCENNKPTGLGCNGNFHAFVSTNASDEIRDMPTNYGYSNTDGIYMFNSSDGIYRKFAKNWNDILDNSLLINVATGLGNTPGNFWTGSQNDGSITPDAAATGGCTGVFWSYQCNNWGFNGTGNCTVGNPYFGTQGNSNSVNNWIRNTSNFSMCSDDKYVLCNCADTSVCINGTTQNCGSNVGECQQGTQTCVSGAWSPICAGEITPKAEICGNGLDEDCDGVADNGCVCVENWTCTPFSACVGGTQSRICTDNNNCGTTLNKPIENQLCLQVEIKRPDDGYDVAGGGVGGVSFEALVLGGTPPYTFNWNSNLEGDFSTNQWPWQDVSLWTIGTHIITATVTDSASQANSDNIQINILPAGTLIANIDTWQTEFARDPTRPANFGVQVSGGATPYIFKWNSNLEGDFATDQWSSVDVSSWTLGDHQVTLTVTDSASNVVTDTETFKISDFIIANMGPHNGQNMEEMFTVWFSASVDGGTAPFSYLWKSDKAGVLNASGPKIDNWDSFQKDDLSLGVHAITLTVTDSNNASVSKTNYLQIIPFVPIDVVINSPANNSTFQQGDDVSFVSNVLKWGVWPHTFKWSSSLDGDISTEKNFNVNNLSVGSHFITMTTIDAKGNTGSASINLTITSPSPVLPVINSPAPNSVFKRIDEVVALFGSATGGVVPYNYSWNSNIDGALGTGDKLFKNDLSVGSHVITFTVKDAVNATVNTSVNITINGGCAISNTKNNAQYSAKEVFFIADENWRDVLAMVPVTTWKDGNTIHAYPSLIYHKEVGNFDVDSSIHFMQQYEPDHLTTVGTTLAAINNLLVASKPVGAGMNAVNINNINASDYFSYWTGYNTLVVVDYNDYKSGLIASVLASEHNSPIIFVNNSNLASYQGIINGKTIYTVGTLDGPTQAYINNNASCQVDYTIEELQKWYSGTSNSNKLILVNPNDLTIKYSQSYTTEKGTAIADMYTKMSLAAPFLAAAKEEVITFSDLGDSGTNTSCSASAVITANAAQADTDAAYAINNFFVNPPDFLTIIATPRALPDSVYDDQCTGSWQHRAPRDWVYGSLDNVDVQINTGRIYGISVADASAHIARSINYDYLRNKIYGANWSSVSVGHSFAYCSNYSKEIRDKLTASGYNASCYTEDSLANCTQSKNPPYSVYKNKNYISFADHGSPYAWYQTMDYNNIPWLDMTVSIGTACLTNDYWQYTNRNFGAHMIRRGALGYVGAVGIAWTSSGNIITNGIKYLGEDANLTTGEMFLKLRVAGNCWDNDYILMGDPTLQPKFKAVTW